MLNQVAVEALYSATYVENYLDAVENLPDEIQRYITRIREIDVKHRSYLRDVDIFYEQWANCPTNELESTNATKRNRAMTRIQQSLIAAQELGDEKLQIVQQLTDLIETKTRQLDQNFKNLDYASGHNSSRDTREDTPPQEEAIDPDEPTYCLCDQISFGEMILCDNDLCPIEWFHFSCVGLATKPKGKWYCPNCRGDRPNVMKPKAQFLKELERYNKEKEEKT
uniref:Inhibitor of growth protein n=1 Tax=Culicoides sonorensis TaxID=179676 RepID=A0A336MZ97_CULSO